MKWRLYDSSDEHVGFGKALNMQDSWRQSTLPPVHQSSALSPAAVASAPAPGSRPRAVACTASPSTTQGALLLTLALCQCEPGVSRAAVALPAPPSG